MDESKIGLLADAIAAMIVDGVGMLLTQQAVIAALHFKAAGLEIDEEELLRSLLMEEAFQDWGGRVKAHLLFSFPELARTMVRRGDADVPQGEPS